jgi:hypothetical protein
MLDTIFTISTVFNARAEGAPLWREPRPSRPFGRRLAEPMRRQSEKKDIPRTLRNFEGCG